MAERIAWAGDLAASLLVPVGRRWAHSLGVVERARAFSDVLPAGELDVLVAAAYLHIGYASQLARTGFHPLDGARFLRALGRERLACLVAYHSGARAEAEERGLLDALGRVPVERSLVADALTYCDLTTAPDGSAMAASARLTEVSARYGDNHPASGALRRSREELLALVSRVVMVERKRAASAAGRGRGRARARRGGAAA